MEFRPIADRMKTHVLGAKYNGYAYSYLSRAQPLDLLLFHGGDTFSDGIRALSGVSTGNGDFSHAGLIVTSEVLPHVPELEKGKLYVWEATMSYSLGGITDGVPDVESGKGRFGIQIRDLEQVVNAYVGDSNKTAMAWCQLSENTWLRRGAESKSVLQSRRKRIIQKMRQLHDRIGRAGFERNPIGVLAAFVPFMRPVRDGIDRVIIDGVESISWLSDEADEIQDDIGRRIEVLQEVMGRNPAVARAIKKVDKKERRHGKTAGNVAVVKTTKTGKTEKKEKKGTYSAVVSSSSSSSLATSSSSAAATVIEYGAEVVEYDETKRWWQRPTKSDFERVERKEKKARAKSASKAERKFLKELDEYEIGQDKEVEKAAKDAKKNRDRTDKAAKKAAKEAEKAAEKAAKKAESDDDDDDEEKGPSGTFIALDRPSSRWLFCSEMVAVIYIELGIMDKEVNPADVLPVHMIMEGDAQVADTAILIFPQPI